MKNSSYLYQYIFVGPPLIKTPRLLILDTFCQSQPDYLDPPLIWPCEEYVFQNRDVPCNYQVREEEAKPQSFDLMCKSGRLCSFAGS